MSKKEEISRHGLASVVERTLDRVMEDVRHPGVTNIRSLLFQPMGFVFSSDQGGFFFFLFRLPPPSSPPLAFGPNPWTKSHSTPSSVERYSTISDISNQSDFPLSETFFSLIRHKAVRLENHVAQALPPVNLPRSVREKRIHPLSQLYSSTTPLTRLLPSVICLENHLDPFTPPTHFHHAAFLIVHRQNRGVCLA